MRVLGRWSWIAGALAVVLCLGVAGDALAQGSGTKRPAVPGGISDKPYLKNFTGGIAVGGYMDHEFLWREHASTFDQHRFIPFIYAAPTDFIHVSAEIEFEHGGAVESGSAAGMDTDGDGQVDVVTSSGAEGEIKLEYAVIDWLFDDALNVRGGVILSPLGKFNIIHDSPLNDLTNRPLVSQQLIPTTLSESGIGVYGTFYPQDWVVAYEVYLVNGFNDGIVANDRLRVRSGRGSQRKDNNENKSLVGRLSASPLLGVDIGVSAHTGAYDAAGERNLSLVALDLDVRRGPFQLIGEGALVSADVEQPESAGAAVGAATARIADSQAGFYAQANVHFGFGVFRRYPDGVFTGAVRIDRVDFDSDIDGDDVQMLTAGLNFRPVEGTVAKIDHRWEWNRKPGQTKWSVPDNLLSLSLATYF